MAPDLNYKPNSRCSLAHVPSSSSSSSSNCKQSTVKCTPLTACPNDLGYSGNQSTANSQKLTKSNHSKCLDCCSAQHERSNRSQPKAGNQKHFKSSANEPFGQSNGAGHSYLNANRTECCTGKCPEKCGADKCNERYERCSYSEKYNNDRCNDKYASAADRHDRQPHGDKCADRCGDKFAADKCPERYPTGNFYQDKCFDSSRPDKQLAKQCGERGKGSCWESATVCQPAGQAGKPAVIDKQSADNKQSADEELTPYEKVLRGLKKRAKHRIERKEEDSNPYVGMYRLRKEIGNGNFSQVFIGAHCLTKGS